MDEKKEKAEKEKKEKPMCHDECLEGWCEQECKADCKDCDMEGCPTSCSKECVEKCHGCAKCHLMNNDPKELEHKVKEEVCGDKCMNGWCEDNCEVCDDCTVLDGEVDCPKDSKCP